MDSTLEIPIPNKGDIKKYKNYRTLSLICHSIKILLKIIFKRLRPNTVGGASKIPERNKHGGACIQLQKSH